MNNYFISYLRGFRGLLKQLDKKIKCFHRCCSSLDGVEKKSDDEKNVIRNSTEILQFKNDHVAKYVLDCMSKYSSSIALINGETDERLTFSELERKILKTANILLRLGLKKGDVVTLFSPNSINYPVVVFAATLIGASCSPVNYLYNADELVKLVSQVEPSTVFTTRQLVATVNQILPQCPYIKRVLLIDSDSDIFVEQNSQSPIADVRNVDICTEDVAVLPFSSGTTGVPKAVQLTHSNLVYNLQQALNPDRLDFRNGDRILSVLPYFHIFGYMANMMGCMVTGATQVIMSRFNPEVFLKCLDQYQCSYLTAVPPMVLFMCRHPLAVSTTFPNVRAIVTGAAPTPVSLIEEIRKKLKAGAIVKQAYGLTETSPAVCIGLNSNPKDDSVGPVIPHTELKVLDANDQILPRQQNGEICVRGPQIMKGYYKNDADNEQTFTKDGWLRTGDIGSVDEKDFVYLFDRSKELIKVKGFQVAPAELESILLSHPLVADTAVIGVPDDQLGEKPRAYVVLKKTDSVKAQELVQFVEGKVAAFKRLTGGVEFVQEIPKSQTGKILRRVLKEKLLS
ncbi:hypothetical protein HELRODRAFT_102106 [Helobdella robusta]|uniref:4-coumarate--CoA ligase n=1 Tax=Helobdella robusta TaxID=6412 RepID=T1ED80_HELRO|nr:hypothetical protein HELRODRAFT_102106 [Helobdella robusta]ESN97366.1 hypothetical protein HELRODRAFT_102106 [Helobdella robusta]